MRSMTFLIVHYTVHIPRWGKFTTGGVITDRRKLLSLVSQQSTIFHCTVCITIMAKFTNFWLLLCRISYILPYIYIYIRTEWMGRHKLLSFDTTLQKLIQPERICHTPIRTGYMDPNFATPGTEWQPRKNNWEHVVGRVILKHSN